MMNSHSYDKYLTDDSFLYDEQSTKNGQFLRQDTELFHDEDYIPGDSIEVKRVGAYPKEDWVVLVNTDEILNIKGTRLSSTEKKFLRSPEGLMFIINGVKSGWNTVSEFKRQLKDL